MGWGTLLEDQNIGLGDPPCYAVVRKLELGITFYSSGNAKSGHMQVHRLKGCGL